VAIEKREYYRHCVRTGQKFSFMHSYQLPKQIWEEKYQPLVVNVNTPNQGMANPKKSDPISLRTEKRMKQKHKQIEGTPEKKAIHSTTTSEPFPF